MKIDKLSNKELQSLIEVQEAIVSDATHEKEFELKILSALQELKDYRDIKEEAVKQIIQKCFMTKHYENPGMEEGMCAGLRTLGGDGEPCDTCKTCMMCYGYNEE